MFYENFLKQCNKKNISPSAAAEEMGFIRSVVTRWSKGTKPRNATLSRIANYFQISIEELETGLTTEKEPRDTLGPKQLLLYEKMLNLSPEQLDQALQFVDYLIHQQN